LVGCALLASLSRQTIHDTLMTDPAAQRPGTLLLASDEPVAQSVNARTTQQQPPRCSMVDAADIFPPLIKGRRRAAASQQQRSSMPYQWLLMAACMHAWLARCAAASSSRDGARQAGSKRQYHHAITAEQPNVEKRPCDFFLAACH
jgi:hypothetical protein